MSEPAVILRSVGSQAPPPAPKSRKKEMVYGGLAATGLLMLVLTFHWFILSRSRIVTDNAYVDTEMMPVHSRIMGYLKEVPVSENESVKKGQVLAQIDDTDLNVELSFKQAKFNKASADEGRGRKLIRSNAISAADLENAEANLIAMKADLEGTLLKLQYTKIVSQTDGVIAKKGAQPGQFVQPGQNLFVIVPDHLIWVKANYK
ncbi:MAG: HlyD family secretion protein, partial [Bdellovibrionota bacterium]